VHALAALRATLGETAETAVQMATDLALEGQNDPSWARLQDAEVHVFEDTTGGLESALAAQRILEEAGTSIHIALYGISPEEVKAGALQSAGATTFDTLSEALLHAQVIM
jgi:hypothetical protein